MSILGYIHGQARSLASQRAKRKLSRQVPQRSFTRMDWADSLKDPNGFYLDCVRFFYQKLPGELRSHRDYFHNVPSDRRGFGEDAFHVMWYLLLNEFKPSTFLEIGIFRGQVISLVALWASMNKHRCDVHGISPFSPAGDSVSRYRTDIDYHEDTLKNFGHFALPAPHLLRAYSTDPAATTLIASRQWDCIYIDGNHDYAVARQDWENCSRNIKPGGIIVLDDAGLSTTFEPPLFASKGHPGPSRLADEMDQSAFREVLQVGHNRAFQKI